MTTNFPWNTGSKQNVIQEDKFIEMSSICCDIPALYFVPKSFNVDTPQFVKKTFGKRYVSFKSNQI